MVATPMPNDVITNNNGHDKESLLHNAQVRIKDTVDDVRKELKHEVDKLAEQVDKVKDDVKKSYRNSAELIEDKITGKKFDLRALAGVFLFGIALGKLLK